MTIVETPTSVALWGAWAGMAFLASVAATYGAILFARTFGVLDVPNDRSSHVRPTPRGGGISIVLVGIAAVFAAIAFGYVPRTHASWAAIGAVIVAAVSSLDDVVTLSAKVRLAAHVSVAMLAVAGLGPIESIDAGPLGIVPLGVVAWPFTVVWIVGMTNAFNFMDGIDGIAGITGVAALGVIAAALLISGEQFCALVAAALAAASAGFLVWNWQPARIFMGDVGSAFLGYVIAVLPLTAAGEARAWSFSVTACVMWPFLFDTSFTMIRRIAKRENIFEAHRSHLYQRLVIAGWPHCVVTLLYGALSAAAGGAALAVYCGPGEKTVSGAYLACAIAIAAVGLVMLVRCVEAKPACAVS